MAGTDKIGDLQTGPTVLASNGDDEFAMALP